jgi:4-hydroxybenzoate polyprenyltransferase
VNLKAYWRLMRLNKPIGILLLWYPTAWSLWMANQGVPSLKLLFLFFLGTVLMRSAGCVINDIADRDIDKHVQRTQFRPLTAGVISLTEALTLLFLLLMSALIVLINLPSSCFIYAIISVGITFLYPFCKRFIQAPQLILGIAFSMGIPMGYAASQVPWDTAMLCLFLLNFIWILVYDTMYAMADKEDDIKIGVKSTAIYFGDMDKAIIGLLQCTMHFIWLYLAFLIEAHWSFYWLWTFAAGILIYQQQLIYNRIPSDCFKAFGISSYYGTLMWLAMILNASCV